MKDAIKTLDAEIVRLQYARKLCADADRRLSAGTETPADLHLCNIAEALTSASAAEVARAIEIWDSWP